MGCHRTDQHHIDATSPLHARLTPVVGWPRLAPSGKRSGARPPTAVRNIQAATPTQYRREIPSSIRGTPTDRLSPTIRGVCNICAASPAIRRRGVSDDQDSRGNSARRDSHSRRIHSPCRRAAAALTPRADSGAGGKGSPPLWLCSRRSASSTNARSTRADRVGVDASRVAHHAALRRACRSAGR